MDRDADGRPRLAVVLDDRNASFRFSGFIFYFPDG